MNPLNRFARDCLLPLLDFALGWLLEMPRDLALLTFAVITALLVTLSRRCVTNQDLLRRCAADSRRLKILLKQARMSGDKPCQFRLRRTIAQIKGMQFSADMRLMAAVLIPVGVLAFWANERFEFLPPTAGEDLIVRAYYPLSSVEQLAHIVPEPGLEIRTNPIQIVRLNRQSSRGGIAEWSIRPLDAGRQIVTIRHQGETLVHPVQIGRRNYLPPQVTHSNSKGISTEVVLRHYSPLGMMPGHLWLGLPPWIIGYILLTMTLTPILKRLFRVA